MYELVYTERVLAIGRASVALVSIIMVAVGAEHTGVYPQVVGMLLQVFGVSAAGMLLVARSSPMQLRRSAVLLHVHDLLWGVVITAVTDGPASIFFGFFFYVLIGAAYRWGLAGAFRTALVINGLLVIQGWASEAGLMAHVPPGGTDWGTLTVRGALLIAVALFVGHLAREQRRLRDEAALTSAIVASARIEAGLQASLTAATQLLLEAFVSPRLWIVLRDAANGSTVLCDALLRDGEVLLTILAVSPSEAAAWEFTPPAPCDGFVAWRRGADANPHRWALWPGDIKRPGGRAAPVLADTPWQAAIGANVVHSEWTGQLVLLDPSREDRRMGRAAFLSRAVRQATPAFLGLLLMQRLRTRAGAIERARVARDLHDGVIQSLSGLQLQVEAVRRQIPSAPEAADFSLQRVQAILQQEVLEVRDLMYQLRHTDVDPRRVVEHMTEAVERFRRETGITATFVSGLQDPDLPRGVARELLRVLQEALVNIRKHSGAQNVVVRFGGFGDYWGLIVDDDGLGFEFAGHYTLGELDRLRRGPVVLKERVRELGGQLWVTSEPGRGARLEIHVPRARHDR